MITLRPLRESELHAASRLCLRSKAYWWYNTEFMRKCAAELTPTVADMTEGRVIGAIKGGRLIGIAQVTHDANGCFFEKLFVDPDAMGLGAGRKLFEWAAESACRLRAKELIVEADPDAAPFTRKWVAEGPAMPLGIDTREDLAASRARSRIIRKQGGGFCC